MTYAGFFMRVMICELPAALSLSTTAQTHYNHDKSSVTDHSNLDISKSRD